MNALQAIAMADALQPNAYAPELKLGWLNDLDGMLYREVLLWHEDAPAAPAPYTGGETLLAQEPYSILYADYLMAMMDVHDGEYERYQNAMLRFNSAYSTFADFYNRTHLPLQGPGVRV